VQQIRAALRHGQETAAHRGTPHRSCRRSGRWRPVFLFLLLRLAPPHQHRRMVGVEPTEPALALAEYQDDGALVAPEDLAFVPRRPSRFRHRPDLASHTDAYPDGLRRRRLARGTAADVARLLSGDVPSALAWQLWTACGNRSRHLDAIFTRYIFTYGARDGSLGRMRSPLRSNRRGSRRTHPPTRPSFSLPSSTPLTHGQSDRACHGRPRERRSRRWWFRLPRRAQRGGDPDLMTARRNSPRT
jgi:hypothetical protein